jgi:opacity protein-like surface antigen
MQHTKRHIVRMHTLTPIKNLLAFEYEYLVKSNVGLCVDFGGIGINESETPFLQPYGWASGVALKVYNTDFIAPKRDKNYQKSSKTGAFFTARIGHERFSAWTVNPNLQEDLPYNDSNPYYVQFDRELTTLFVGGGVQLRITDFINVETGYALGYSAFNKSTLGKISELSRNNLNFHQGSLYDRNSGLAGRFWLNIGVFL